MATALLLLALSGAGDAVPAPGSRVRVTATGHAAPLTGTLAAVEAGSLLVSRPGTDPPARIALADVTKLEVSGGRKSRTLDGALVGAGVGTLPGLALTFGDYDSDVHGSGPPPLAVAAVGAVTGAALGAAIGWAVKSEQWSQAAVPSVSAGVAPLRGGGVAFCFGLAWGGHARGR